MELEGATFQGLIHDTPTCAELAPRIVTEARALILGRLADRLAWATPFEESGNHGGSD